MNRWTRVRGRGVTLNVTWILFHHLQVSSCRNLRSTSETETIKHSAELKVGQRVIFRLYVLYIYAWYENVSWKTHSLNFNAQAESESHIFCPQPDTLPATQPQGLFCTALISLTYNNCLKKGRSDKLLSARKCDIYSPLRVSAAVFLSKLISKG